MEYRQENNFTNMESLEHLQEKRNGINDQPKNESSLVECQAAQVNPREKIINELFDLASVLAELLYDDNKADLKTIEFQYAKLDFAVNSIPSMYKEDAEKWTQTLKSYKKSIDKNMNTRKSKEMAIKLNQFKTTCNEMKNFLQTKTVAITDFCIDWDQSDQMMITVMTDYSKMLQFDINEETSEFLGTNVEHLWLLYHQLKEREEMENQPKKLICKSDQNQQQDQIKMDGNNTDSNTATFSDPSNDLPLTFPSIENLTNDLQNSVTFIELLLTLRPLDIKFIESTISDFNTAIEKIPQTEVELFQNFAEKTVNLMGRFLSIQEEEKSE